MNIQQQIFNLVNFVLSYASYWSRVSYLLIMLLYFY